MTKEQLITNLIDYLPEVKENDKRMRIIREVVRLEQEQEEKIRTVIIHSKL